MKHIVIMPEDCYKATEGRFKDCIVRKSSMGIEILAGYQMPPVEDIAFTKESRCSR